MQGWWFLAGLAEFSTVNKKKLISQQLSLQKKISLSNGGSDDYKSYLSKLGFVLFLMITPHAK